jgi:hypothetical protein
MRIAYKLDGNVHIVIPAEGVTYDQLLATIPTDATDLTPLEASHIPADRTYRDAWEIGANVVSVDMPKARVIHMSRLRVKRNERLKQLDTDYLKADEDNDGQQKTAIKAKKQQLRDMPQTYDLSTANTPEELKLMIPDYLEAK